MGVLTQFQDEIFKKRKKSTTPKIFVTPYDVHGICVGRSLMDAAETHSKYKYLDYVLGTQTTNYDDLLAESLRDADDRRCNEARIDDLGQDRSELYYLSLAEKIRFEAKIHFLESQLHADRPYAQLYKLGAGSLFVAIISLAFWGLTGIGAPFHPIFAAAVLPASIGIIVMAFLVRHEKKEGKTSDKNIR